MVEEERIHRLTDKPIRDGDYVLYWIQASHRTTFNGALQVAIQEANRHHLPVLAYFGLTSTYPFANERHMRFLLEGLKEVGRSLEGMGIRFILSLQSPSEGAIELSRQAALTVVDMAYQRVARNWVQEAAEATRCSVLLVEDNVIVPVQTASPKEEYSAATLRPKIHTQLPRFLVARKEEELPDRDFTSLDLESEFEEDTDALIARLKIDQNVPAITTLPSGPKAAEERLRFFLEQRLDDYPEARNDPTLDGLSHLSPYLHYGQISPLYVALRVMEAQSPGEEVFLEELIVRRELAMNYVFYNPSYDTIDGLPRWARETLRAHRADPRPYVYTLEELEQAKTHDPAWNAAQNEMRTTGTMHGYMRMYWGKKILEWSSTPEGAFERAVILNDRYELDGRDPNGYAGIAWCLGKHDRPWKERPVFGKIRYMSAAGLERKFDVEKYVKRWGG
jgi:deoxyribodipyrimidine photo-lyase